MVVEGRRDPPFLREMRAEEDEIDTNAGRVRIAARTQAMARILRNTPALKKAAKRVRSAVAVRHSPVVSVDAQCGQADRKVHIVFRTVARFAPIFNPNAYISSACGDPSFNPV